MAAIFRPMLAATGIAVAVALAGCVGTAPAATRTPTTPPSLGVIGSVDDLVTAYVGTGRACDWEPVANPKFAAELGSCSSDTTLAYYISRSDMQDTIATLREISTDTTVDLHLLVGPNWIINSPAAAALSLVLGGTLITE